MSTWKWCATQIISFQVVDEQFGLLLSPSPSFSNSESSFDHELKWSSFWGIHHSKFSTHWVEEECERMKLRLNCMESTVENRFCMHSESSIIIISIEFELWHLPRTADKLQHAISECSFPQLQVSDCINEEFKCLHKLIEQFPVPKIMKYCCNNCRGNQCLIVGSFLSIRTQTRMWQWTPVVTLSEYEHYV